MTLRNFVADRAAGLRRSAIRDMFDRAAQMPDAINLGLGEPDFPTPPHVVEAALAAARDGATRYTASSGIPPLREAVAEAIERSRGVRYDPRTEVIVTAGGMGALSLALLASINPGDEVLLADPGWPNHASQVAMVGGVAVRFPLKLGDEAALVAEELEALCTPRTRAILLNSPSNPTGRVLTAGEVQAVVEMAERWDLLIISDEVYDRIVFDRPHVSPLAFPGARARTVLVNSLSKTYAMTGWRVGYAAGPAELIGRMTLLQENLMACPPAPCQHAALAALTGPQECIAQMVAEYRARRELAVEGLNRIPGFACRRPEGTFYCFVDGRQTGLDDRELGRLLVERAHVVTVPGSGFGPAGAGHLRLSLAASPSALQEALARMERVVSEVSVV